MNTGKNRLLIFILLLAVGQLRAQTGTDFANNVDTATSGTYAIVEKMPEYKGGYEALSKFLREHIVYPKEARDERISGKVYVKFIITKTGELDSVRVIKGAGHGMDEEAMRVIRLTNGNWEPGMQNNENVNVNFTIPISFTTDGSTNATETSSQYQRPVSQVMNYLFSVWDDTLISFIPAYYNYLVPPGHRLLFNADSLIILNRNNEIDYSFRVPVFPGGIDSLDKYIYQHLKYPREAMIDKKEGIVDVYFNVGKTGKIGKINIGEFYGYGCGDEASRIFRSMPEWQPGYQEGKAVDFSFHWKIKFRLIDGKPMTYEQFKQQQTLEKAVTIYNWGLIQLKQDNPEHAIAVFSKVIALNPLNYDAYYSRGIAKALLPDLEEACKDWNKALELGGRDIYQYAAKNCK